MRLIALLSVPFVVWGCGYYEGYQGGDAAQDIHVLMIGNSKEEVLACAGKPTRVDIISDNSENWHYIYPYSKYNNTDVYYESYIDILFEENEVSQVKPSANRSADSIGLEFDETLIAFLSYEVIKNCGA